MLGTRYRVVRVERFIRLGPDGPEPPRPSDPDPGTGVGEGLLKFDLTQVVLKAGAAPPDRRGDSLRAVETHPGGVPLPAEFAIAECGRDGQWKPYSGSAPSPQAARVEQLVRIGPDGPEGPRPSDFDPDPPVEAHPKQLRDQGRLDDDEDDDEDDAPVELGDEMEEMKRLMDKERARRAERMREREAKNRSK